MVSSSASGCLTGQSSSHSARRPSAAQRSHCWCQRAGSAAAASLTSASPRAPSCVPRHRPPRQRHSALAAQAEPASTGKTTVGFLGLGIMGTGMVRALLGGLSWPACRSSAIGSARHVQPVEHTAECSGACRPTTWSWQASR